jgi:nitroreductase
MAEPSRADLLRAIGERHAVRRYEERPITPADRAGLAEVIDAANARSGLHIQAVYDEPAAFGSRRTHYGKFEGVANYLAFVGPADKSLATKAGYWGELVVLQAQLLGLNTCWVVLTYDRSKSGAQVGLGEEEVLVATLGYGQNQGVPHRSKPVEKLGQVAGGGEWPDWFRAGVEAAALAPTAVNQQRFTFALSGDVVTAKPGLGPYTKIDIGIAARHFEIGAGEGGWRWAAPIG